MHTSASTSSPGLRFRGCRGRRVSIADRGDDQRLLLVAGRASRVPLAVSFRRSRKRFVRVPDVGITTLADVVEDARRITSATSLPLLVDVDTGFGDMAQTVREMIRVGVAAIHLEDQVDRKRCGHLPGKQLVSAGEMVERVKAALDARTDPGFVVMARTDAASVEDFPPRSTAPGNTSPPEPT